MFLLTGIGGSLHWGGSIAVGNPGLDIAFLLFYMAVTAMGDWAFLDLALRYGDPNGSLFNLCLSASICGFSFFNCPI